PRSLRPPPPRGWRAPPQTTPAKSRPNGSSRGLHWRVDLVRRLGYWTIQEANRMAESLEAQLQKTLNTIPAYTWYAVPSGTLTCVNERYADSLGLARNDPLRSGVETGVPWD